MNDLIAHRGPDDAGIWMHERGHVGFGHRRLSIIDPTPAGHQPMRDDAGRWITYNGEVYNYPELRLELGGPLPHRLRHRGRAARPRPLGRRLARPPARHVRLRAVGRGRAGAGLRARPLRDQAASTTPQVGDVLYFASEAKALLPFLPAIETDLEGLKDYLAFQFCLAGKTLFEGVRELLPGHRLRVRNGTVGARALLGGLLRPRLRPHGEVLRGADRGAARTSRCGCTCAATCRSPPTSAAAWTRRSVASLASRRHRRRDEGVHRPLPGGQPLRRERATRRRSPTSAASTCTLVDIDVDDFLGSIEQVIYHLDYPVAGPGSFPQYMVSAGRRARARR